MTDGVGAGGAGFGIENLPFGVARLAGGAHACVSALAAKVIDLSVLDRAGSFADVHLPDGVLEEPSLNGFLACGRSVVGAVRARLAELIRADDDRLESSLLPRRAVDMLVPVAVGDFVDFHGSVAHARNMGRLLRGTSDLPPNWRRLPRAYHGRAGSIVPSGTPIMRPYGQVPGDEHPVVGITRKLDFEVEVGFVVGVGNEPGRPVRTSAFADHVAGLLLVNDWSARDVQALEAQPLGPFLGKSFATSVSPWIITLDALEPYRVDGPAQDPAPPPYLAPPPLSAYDIRLEVSIQSQWMRVNDIPAAAITHHRLADQYWTFPQMLAHTTVNGTTVRPGDLFASGTVSGSEPGTEGCLMELALNGERPVPLPDGTTRTFLEDGDTVTITGWAGGGGDGRPLLCIGEVVGTVRAARRLEV
ncbi:MAG: fumarylacetoacetase [Actinomycetota bacterium]|jgi:fumarylacetoacetase|nr:fumarylacetoacetase [Actinomycetota bacterium]